MIIDHIWRLLNLISGQLACIVIPIAQSVMFNTTDLLWKEASSWLISNLISLLAIPLIRLILNGSLSPSAPLVASLEHWWAALLRASPVTSLSLDKAVLLWGKQDLNPVYPIKVCNKTFTWRVFSSSWPIWVIMQRIFISRFYTIIAIVIGHILTCCKVLWRASILEDSS